MKYFGFIKEHGDYKYSKSIKDLITEKKEESSNRIEVINYLKSGKLCVAWMGFVEDAANPRFSDENYDDNDFMGFIAVNTDGEWFWPQYIVNYLEKYPSFKIDEEFVKHVLNKKGKKIDLSEEKVLELEKKYDNEN